MIDYCQSLFAAMPLTPESRVHTDEEFQRIKEHIRHLFRTVQHYVFLLSAPNISATENAALSHLIAQLTYHWIFIRSDRHAYFEIPHFADLFTPLDSLLQRVLGVSAETLLEGLSKLLSNAQAGIGDSGARLIKIFDSASQNPNFEALFMPSDSTTPDDKLAELADLAGVEQSSVEDALHSFIGTRLFEVKRATDWPDNLLNLLSYAPGDAGNFLSPEDRAAWPTRVWPIFQRPFIRWGEETYCFDHIAFCDRFYRQITRALRSTDPTCADELNKIQAQTVESIAAQLIGKLLPDAEVFRNAYYQSDGEWCEADLVAVYKDTLLVAEMRSGSLTIASYFASIQNLLIKPSSQAWRLLRLLEAQSVDLYDSNKGNNKIGRVDKSCIGLRVPLVVSLDSLHMMGAHFANTMAAVERQIPATWVITIDDLRCFAELFASPSIFLHFARIRLQTASQQDAEVLDEMDHVGLYFRENDYVMQAKELNAPVGRHGYTTDIDKYFFQLGAAQRAEAPKQDMPGAIWDLVAACDKSMLPNSRALVSMILDSGSEARTQIDNWVSEQAANTPDGRFRMMTLTFGSEALALAASRSWSINAIQQVFVEAKARLITMANIESSLVALFRIGSSPLTLTSCSFVRRADIGDKERSSLRAVRKAQKKRDFADIYGKIRRNVQCPCGSGLKYKRCHGR